MSILSTLAICATIRNARGYSQATGPSGAAGNARLTREGPAVESCSEYSRAHMRACERFDRPPTSAMPIVAG